MSAPRIVVIGAGLGGLSAACHLAGRGHDVVVVEAADAPGGRAHQVHRDGYTFDVGPTVLTMVDVLRDVFAATGSEFEDHLTLHRLDPAYRAVFSDGSTIRVRTGRDAMVAEIREQCGPGEAAAFDRFCEWLRKLYEVERPSFIERNFDSPFDLARPLGPLLSILRLGGFGRLDARVARFFADERLQRLFSFQALYAGLAPQRALALYAVITYMDTVAGVWAVRGGMGEIARSLASAAEKAGAEIRFGAKVDRILLAGNTTGAVRGVRLQSGEVIPASVVVCNGDIGPSYRKLLPGMDPPRVARRGRYSPSAVVWHAGVRGALPAEVEHHNIHFGTAWSDSFDALERGALMPDPSTLVSVPSVSDRTLAPAGAHVLYGLEPVPNLEGTVHWPSERQRVLERLVGRLAGFGYPTDAEVTLAFDPTDWQRAGLERGTPFSLSHRLFQTGPFRPKNVEARAPGLVFTGAGTTPGVGIPMVLLSGRLAADRVSELLAGEPRRAKR